MTTSKLRPLQISVTNLLRRPGTRQALHLEVPAPPLQVADVIVAEGALVDLDLVLEGTSGDQVSVVGRIAAPYTAECRRCLDPLSGEVVADVKEIFERRPTEGETYLLDIEAVDLTDLVRDALLLALPLAPLCREDCPGPAPEAYPALGVEDDDVPAVTAAADQADAVGAADDPPLADPRWAALRDLRLD